MWSIFAPILRTLSGGRDLAPRADDPAFAFEADWVWVLAKLKLPPHTLREILAAGRLEPHFHYRRFFRKKKDGSRRELAEPDARLKQLQYEVIRRYLTREQAHPAAVAYQAGKSTADHVWPHAGAEVIVVADIQDFFPNTRAERIDEWWRGRVDADAARLLTLLTTDLGGLPQGAPTSPGLSNFVNSELDTRLAQRAAMMGARYTRYCDDLAFSWPLGSGIPSSFEPAVRSLLHEYGYALHPTKGWRVHSRRDEPEVTGVILTRHGGTRLPDRIKQTMRRLERSADPRDLQKLEGYQGYEEMVTRSPRRRKKKKKGKPRTPRYSAPSSPRPPAPPPLPRVARRYEPPPDASAAEDIPF